MAIQDIKSDLLFLQSDYVVVAADGTSDGAIIDTADYELGLMFSLQLPVYTDGSYELVIRESDDPAFASSTVVPDIKLIGKPDPLTAATADGSQLYTVGVFSNLRYVRAVLQASGVATGATAVVNCIQRAELMPVENA